MKHAFKFAALLAFGAGLAGCDIGEGSTIETLELRIQPVDVLEQGTYVDAGLPTERYHMYDCFCSNAALIGTFTDGTVANFANRATLTTSNPAVVEVLNFPDTDEDACPATQQIAGMLIPRGLGTATVTGTFAGLSASMTVEVADTSPGVFTMTAVSPNPPVTDVAVGATLALSVEVTLDGRKRQINRNVMEWTFDNDDPEMAIVSAGGVLTGVGRTGAAPRIARASFGTCTDVSVSSPVNVGDVVAPLLLEREPGFAADGLLQVATDTRLKVTAGLDFDGDGQGDDGTQLLNSQVQLTSTSSCTLREFDATNPPTNCRETATECSNSVAMCDEESETTCPSTLAACRTNPVQMLLLGTTNVVAVVDDDTPVHLTATFPLLRGTPTTLAAALTDTATTLTVSALSGYPTTLPWFAEIDAAGTREVVRVTAIDDNTLTVVRGVGDTAAVAHAAGASFASRAYTSDPVVITDPPKLPIQPKDGTLTTVAIDLPGTLDALGTLQLTAQGTFVDAVPSSRQQSVTHLLSVVEDAPSVHWQTNDPSVALITVNDGLAFSVNSCGGRVSVRARADSSDDDSTAAFDPDTTADDDACKNTDPLCDQVELCVATPSPLPLGLTCETTTTCP